MRSRLFLLFLLLATPANSGPLLHAVGTQCATGSTAGQFVELNAPTAGQFQASMRLVVLDRLGATVLDESSLFDGQPDGTTWPAGRSWLIGLPTIGITPDHVVPALLDTVAGAVELWDGATLLDRVAYGGGQPLARPIRGHALERQTDSTWIDEFSPAPTNYAGAIGSNSDCLCPGPCADSTTAGVRIQAVAFRCANTDSGVRFLELRSTRPNQKYMSFLLGLRVQAPDGTVLFDKTDFLGPGAPFMAPWPEGKSILFATETLAAFGVPADRPLLVNLTPPAGSQLILYDAMLDRGPIQVMTLPALANGESFERLAGDAYGVTSHLYPRNAAGDQRELSPCPCDTSNIKIMATAAVPYAAQAVRIAQDGGEASFNAVTGTVYTRVNWNYFWSAYPHMRALYRLVGPASATPIAFTANYRYSGSSTSTCPPHPVGDCDPSHLGISFRNDAGVTLGGSGQVHGGYVGLSFDKTGSIPLSLPPNSWFHARVDLDTGAINGGSAIALAQLSFDLPPGYSIQTCRGSTFSPPQGLVDVAAPAPGLAFRALGARPATGTPAFECVLPTDGDARIALVDLRGRIVLRKDLGHLPAGSHRVDLDGAASLPAGVYWARLAFGSERAQQRLVLLGR